MPWQLSHACSLSAVYQASKIRSTITGNANFLCQILVLLLSI